MRRLLAALAIAAATTAGCSSADTPTAAPTTAGPAPTTAKPAMPAATMLAAARKSLSTATSVGVTARWKDRVDSYELYADYKPGGGQAALHIDRDIVYLLWTGKDGYFQTSAAYLRKQGLDQEQVAVLADRWVKLPRSSAQWTRAFREHAEPAGFSEVWLTPKGAITEAGTKEFSGYQCRGLRFRNLAGNTITVYVEPVAPYRPTYLELTGASTGTATFGGWDLPFDLKVPAPDEVVVTRTG